MTQPAQAGVFDRALSVEEISRRSAIVRDRPISAP